MFYSPNRYTPVAPEVYLAINKSRIKRYDTNNQPTYYLGDNTEFQLELFNPTRDTVLAKITIDGKNVSQGGLILKPGVRIFLDRPLDIAKKFRFDTYEVENTKETLNAIADNGGVKVEFFRESQVRRPIMLNNMHNQLNINSGLTTTGGYVSRGDSSINLTNFGIVSTTTQDLRGIKTFTDTSSTSNGILRGSAASYTTQGLTNNLFSDSASLDSFESNDTLNLNQPIKKSRSLSKSIETGRVGAGSTSDQKFVGVDMDFEYLPSYQTTFKILPLSQKINEVGETLVKKYCTNCGTKQKPNFKFCPSCGEKC